MAAVHTPSSECTGEQLRAAWAAYRRDTWPPTFEEAMADPVYSRLVRLHASHLANPSHQPPPSPASPASPARPVAARRLHFAPPSAYVDRKRAAAGDRDDD